MPTTTTTTEPVGFKMLAAHYREQADVCLSMAEQALRPYDEEWLRLAAKWTRLARQAELKVGLPPRSKSRSDAGV